MKKEELFDLLNDIDDGYIAEAEEYRKAKRAKIDTRIIRYIGIAASVILVAGILGILLMNMGGRSTSPQSTSAATTADRYAEATEDYEQPTDASEAYETTEYEPTTTLPTEGSGDRIEQPVVMYNGVLYKMSDDNIEYELPEGFEQVGEIIGYDADTVPSEDFYAAGPDLTEGQKIYGNPEDTNVIYVAYDLGEDRIGYRVFKADGI